MFDDCLFFDYFDKTGVCFEYVDTVVVVWSCSGGGGTSSIGVRNGWTQEIC